MNSPRNAPPQALLIISPGCPHCSPVLDALSRMVKQGVVSRLDVINVAWHPERARELGATSAPWTRIGKFELSGTYSEEELRSWAKLAATDSGLSDYFVHLLENRDMAKLVETIEKYPDSLNDLIRLLEDLDVPMAIRIGVGAAIEDLQEQGLLSPAIPKLIALTRSDLPQIRADACHYLGLTGEPEVRPAVKSLLMDEDSEVREIAAETLSLLESDT